MLNKRSHGSKRFSRKGCPVPTPKAWWRGRGTNSELPLYPTFLILHFIPSFSFWKTPPRLAFPLIAPTIPDPLLPFHFMCQLCQRFAWPICDLVPVPVSPRSTSNGTKNKGTYAMKLVTW